MIVRETEVDGVNQRAILAQILTFSIFDVRETPKFAPHDFELWANGQLHGLVEVKRRDATLRMMQSSGSIMLSDAKFRALFRAARRHSVPWFFAVGLDDCVLLYEYAKGDLARIPVKLGGRTVQTRDPKDIEYVRMIPIERFDVVTAIDRGVKPTC